MSTKLVDRFRNNFASQSQDGGRQIPQARSGSWSDQRMRLAGTGLETGPNLFLLGSHVGAFAANRPQLGPWQCNHVGPARLPGTLAYLSLAARERHEWTRRIDF